MKNLWISLKITLAMCIVLGVGYVLVLRGVSAVAGPNGGEADVVTLDGQVVGAADVNHKGERAYASYFEAACPFTVKTVDMKAGVGMVPWNAAATYLTGDRGFCVQNVFLNAGKSWTIKGTDSMSVGVFTNLIWNPALDDVNFVGGISFRM